jgi:curved DNA-binding protein CbpA
VSQQARLPYVVRRDLSSEPMTAERDAYEVLQVHPRAEQQVIQAAYRVLAAMYHPDRSTTSANARHMAELNAAYNKIRTVELRQAYDRQLRSGRGGVDFTTDGPAAVGKPYSPESTGRPLDFGRYEGLTVAQIARRDMDYLRWLRRHASGARFRAEIDAEIRAREPAKPKP